MPVPRTELRDELAALIAAGRELSPDHDQALAEVFIDRVAGRMAAPSRTRPALFSLLDKPRRLLGAVILTLACLVTAGVLGLHPVGGSGTVEGPVAPKAPSIKVPAMPPAPKMPAAPQPPAPAP